MTQVKMLLRISGIRTIALIAFVCGSGCAPVTDSQPIPQMTPTLKPHKIPGPLSYEILEEKEPDQYAIRFTLNSDSESSFHLYRVVSLNKVKGLVLLSSLKLRDQLTLEHQKSGDSFEIELKERNSEKTVQVLKFSLPRDLIIEGNANASDYDFSSVGRLYFKSGATLSTGGQDLKIHAKKWISESGALIAIFPKGAISPDNTPAKSGGVIEVNVEVAEGSLEVNLRGENGGKWTQMPASLEGDESARGFAGGDGEAARVSCYDQACICLKGATDGYPGGNGKPGLPGLDGIPGGDSGDLKVTIKNGSQFKISYHREPGEGGEGTLGGLGGKAGIGGNPGRDDHPAASCRKAVKGQDGNPGPQGPGGQHGRSGQAGQVCLKMSESEGTLCL